jgi:hypothetical protein
VLFSRKLMKKENYLILCSIHNMKNSSRFFSFSIINFLKKKTILHTINFFSALKKTNLSKKLQIFKILFNLFIQVSKTPFKYS